MVTVDAHVVEPLLARRLAQEDVVHLPVVVGEAGVRIGPVLNGQGPCSTCLDLWERDADPCWPALATQMRTLPMPEVEHLVLHEAAASTARAVIDTLVGRASSRVPVLAAVSAVGQECLGPLSPRPRSRVEEPGPARRSPGAWWRPRRG